MGVREDARPLLKPPRLRPGDTIGLVAPSGLVNAAQVDRGIANLQSLGLRVKPGRNLFAAHGSYAGTVAERVTDLHEMFADPEVQGLWAARGGSSASTLLPHLDYALIRANPKALVGFSDVTALHLALLRRAGLVSFHGPVSSSTFSPFSFAHLQAVLLDARAPLEMPLRPRETDAIIAGEPEPRIYVPGVAEGSLVGGNLSTLVALVGTPFMPDTRGAVLFLEDVGEAPYRIDRMLTQLQQAGILGEVAGVALGTCRKCVPMDNEAQLPLQEIYMERFGAARAPCADGFAFGHVPQQLTLPLGIRARMDTATRTITLLETAVT